MNFPCGGVYPARSLAIDSFSGFQQRGMGKVMNQVQNVAIAQQLLAGIAAGKAPDALAVMFAEDLRFEIQGDEGVLPWIGHKTGRQAAADFFRDIRMLTEPVQFEVEDILASTN